MRLRPPPITGDIPSPCGIKTALRLSLAVATALTFATSANAHDFWIEPAKFKPAAEDKIALRIRVGQQFEGEPVLYVPEQIERFVAVGPAGERPVTGIPGEDPAGNLSIAGPGLYVVGYYSKKHEVTFDSLAEFEKYLATEGLERNLVLAQKRFSLRGGVLEVYTRCAKALIGTAAIDSDIDRKLGFPLELTAQRPAGAGRKRTVQLLYRDKPLAGALVVAFNKKTPTEKIKVRTGEDGTATLDLDKPGVWLVNSVHMIPTSVFARADWESFWASLTFELP